MHFTLSLLVLGTATVLPSLAQAANWNLVWSDEFNGNSIDSNKWHYDTGNNGWGNNELEFYTDRSQNSYVSNGFLTIQALREDYGGSQYTSARMNTAGKFIVKFGKVEMRAKLPAGSGVWPAFWLLGNNFGQAGWPGCGEIDIMEWVGTDPTNIHASLHATSFDTTHGFHLDQGFSHDFHTYGVEWHPDHLSFYFDDNVYYTVYKSQSPNNWPFGDHEFFIILNLAIGGNWPGAPSPSSKFPHHFVVDYVRVYKLQNQAAEVSVEEESYQSEEKVLEEEYFLN